MITDKLNNINNELKTKLVNQEQAPSFRIIGLILRIIFGLVFIYSGFVKAIDPLGHTYKMLDYLQAMGLPQSYYITLAGSILMIALEFAIGFGMITGIALRFFSWSALIFMLVMTPLTLWLAATNAVSDCGCFGDALKLSNWATFAKNVVLLVMIISILYFEKYHKPYLSPLPSRLISCSFFLFSIILSVYCLQNLPLIDFLPYKIGNNIHKLMEIPDGAPRDEYETTFTYKNNTTGDTKTFASLADAPWNDSVNWTYVSQNTKLIKKGYQPPIHDLMIESPELGNITEDVLTDKNYVFLFVMYNLNRADETTVEGLNNIYVQMSERGYNVMALTASNPEDIERFKQTNDVLFPFCTSDAIPLKSMIRANPGVLVLRDGVVIDKWNATKTKKAFEQFLRKNNV